MKCKKCKGEVSAKQWVYGWVKEGQLLNIKIEKTPDEYSCEVCGEITKEGVIEE